MVDRVEAAEVVEGRPVFEHPSAQRRALGDRVSALVARAAGVLHRRAVARVLEVLALFCDGAGRCYCAQETIAEKAHFSVRHVARALAQAEAAGLLIRAVPRYSARLCGTATEYALPWWALTVERGLGAVREVLSLRRRGPVVRLSREVAAGLASILETAHPAELVRRVAGRVGGVLGAEVVRAYAAGLLPVEGRGAGADAVGASLRTSCPDKTSLRGTLDVKSAAVRREEGSDRRPSAGECVTAGAVTPVAATISGLREAVRARQVAEAAARARSFSESS